MPEPETNNSNFWASFIRAVEAEPREARPIRGASGLYHPVVALGVDDNRRRVVIISGDSDARSAALAQADIQATLPSLKVIFARPTAVNLAAIANALVSRFGRATFSLNDFPKFPKSGKKKQKMDLQTKALFEEVFNTALAGVGHAPLSAVAAWQDAILQLSHIEMHIGGKEDANSPAYITVGGLVALDPAESDRQSGICSVPLYSINNPEAEAFHRGNDLDEVRAVLRRLDVFQYFFPAPDQLALALMDSHLATPSSMVSHLQLAPELGHPLGPVEIVDSRTPIEQLIDSLQEKGLCVEGEMGYELTDSGRISRGIVRFKPREGLLAKLSRILSVKIDVGLKDLFK